MPFCSGAREWLGARAARPGTARRQCRARSSGGRRGWRGVGGEGAGSPPQRTSTRRGATSMVGQRGSMLRPAAQTLKRALRARARQLRLLAPSVRRIAEDPRFDAFDGLLWTSERAMTPTGAADANRALVTDLLEE